MALKLSTGMRNARLADAANGGKGLAEILKLGVIKIYSSPRPASADDAESGTLLATITDTSGAYTPADGTNGLTFDAPVAGVLSKSAAQTWSGVGVATGTAAWFRFYPVGAAVEGASTTVPRIDGSVGTSAADLIMSGSTVVQSAATQTIDSCNITEPSGE